MNENGGETLTAVSLFSGIGGFDLGIERAGFRVLVQAESEPYRRDVLRARFGGAELYDDVRAVGEPAWRAAADRAGAPVDERRREAGTGVQLPDLLFGGFPCQGLSVAGKRRGLADERSGLFFVFVRVAEALRPRAVLLENVPGLLSSNGGRDFGVVLESLADLGYGVAWRILDSRFFGVPQRRRRVFILGVEPGGRTGADRAGQILAVGTRCGRHPATGDQEGPGVAGTLGGSVGKGRGNDGNPFDRGGLSSLSGMGSGGPDDNDAQAGRLVVAAPLTSGGHPNSNAPGRRKEDDENLVPMAFNWQTGGDMRLGYGEQPTALQVEQTTAAHIGSTVRRLLPVECERLQGFPDDWTQLGDTADSPRYAALGNAVTVNVAEWIGHQLVQHLRAEAA